MRKQSRPAAAAPRPRPARPPAGAAPLADLGALLVFARVVQRRSFTQAARDLETTTSAVSKRIARLEQQVRARLLTRTTRHVVPTEAGLALYQSCLRILREVEDAELLVAGMSGAPRGLLRVSAPVHFGEQHVAPLLARLVAEHAELRLELQLTDRFVDLVAEGVDLAVRVGHVGGQTLVARTLYRARLVACAAPSYLARRGTPAEPGVLLEHDCLRYTLEATPHTWHFRAASGEALAIPVTGPFDSDHGGALREAAVAGLGVCYLPAFYVDEALDRGQLVAILEAFSPGEASVHAVYPSGRLVPPKTRAAIDLLSEALPARLARCAQLLAAGHARPRR